jgi:hypothetical protein
MMFKRSFIGLLIALLILAMLTIPALAGGVIVSLDGMPATPHAGEPFTVGFTIFSAHDGSAQAGMAPIITATHATTQEKVTVTAQSEGEPGHYQATLTLPSAGEWNWEIQPLGKYAENYPPSVMTPLQVSTAGVQLAPQSQAALTPMPWMALAGVTTLAALVALVFLFERRKAALRS